MAVPNPEMGGSDVWRCLQQEASRDAKDISTEFGRATYQELVQNRASEADRAHSVELGIASVQPHLIREACSDMQDASLVCIVLECLFGGDSCTAVRNLESDACASVRA